MKQGKVNICSALLSLLGTMAAAAQPTGNADNGRRLFMADGCYECHGTTGAGSGVGPKLAPDPLPLEAIRSQLRQPAGRMPAYSAAVISDDEIGDIAAYLHSVPRGKAESKIPLLNGGDVKTDGARNPD